MSRLRLDHDSFADSEVVLSDCRSVSGGEVRAQPPDLQWQFR